MAKPKNQKPPFALRALAAFAVTLTALLNVNPQIKNPNRIAAGERVTLP